MAEKRVAERVQSAFSGVLIVNEAFLCHCVLKDVSETGMRLELADSVEVPAEFHVKTTVLPELLPVSLVWQNGKSIGVHLEDVDLDDSCQTSTGAEAVSA